MTFSHTVRTMKMSNHNHDVAQYTVGLFRDIIGYFGVNLFVHRGIKKCASRLKALEPKEERRM